MRKLMLVAIAFAFSMSLLAIAQDTTKPDTQQPTAKTETMKATLTGKISDDGKTFVSDKDNKSWTVSNPDAVKGHEGHEVTVKARVDEAKNEINVVSVKMAKGEKKEPMKKD